MDSPTKKDTTLWQKLLKCIKKVTGDRGHSYQWMSFIFNWGKIMESTNTVEEERASAEAEVESMSTIWMERFLRDNRYFCWIDRTFLTDTFSHYGLQAMVPDYKRAMTLIMDEYGPSNDSADEFLKTLDEQASHLYGLLHARYILTMNGLDRMRILFTSAYWGTCPRIGCKKQALLPMGLHDEPGVETVKFYCIRCRLTFKKDPEYSDIDGCYFGTTFPHLFFMEYTDLLPPRAIVTQVVPTIYGFKLHKSWYDKCLHQNEGNK